MRFWVYRSAKPSLHSRYDSDMSIAFSHHVGADNLFHSEVDINLASDGDAAPTLAQTPNESQNGIADTTGGHDGNGNSGVDHPIDVPGVKSKHTSRTSTVDGDEVGLEENGLADEFLVADDEPVDTLAPENDEIDWENDGDDQDQKSAMTPSSISGKRGRTNDAESLTDEAGMLVCLPQEVRC